MIFEAKVHPGAREAKVVRGDKLEVWVKERADKGKANKAVIRTVAAFFSVPTAKVRIVRGHSSRKKLVEVDF
jgi:uncharacterized protein